MKAKELLSRIALITTILLCVLTFFTDDAARIARTAAIITTGNYFLLQGILIELRNKH